MGCNQMAAVPSGKKHCQLSKFSSSCTQSFWGVSKPWGFQDLKLVNLSWKWKVSSIIIFEIKQPLNNMITIPHTDSMQSRDCSKCQMCNFSLFPPRKSEGGRQEVDQSATGTIWCNMRYAICRKLVQEARFPYSWEQQRQQVVQVSRDTTRMQGMRYHKCQWK